MTGSHHIRLLFAALVQDVAVEHHITTAELLGRNRSLSFARARKVLFRRLRDRGLSLPEIGRLVGRHHTTILHALKGSAPGTGAR